MDLISLLRKLQNLFSRPTLITMYKFFVRPHLDYENILYDQTYNSSFHEKQISVQYNACLALTGAIRGSSKDKNISRTWFWVPSGLSLVRKTLYINFVHKTFFYKVLNNEHPQYLFHLILVRSKLYSTRNALNIPLPNTNHSFF